MTLQHSSNNILYVFASIAILMTSVAADPAQAHTRVSYVPGVAIVPDILEPNGSTPRTYRTPAGLSYWTPDLPIQHGDRVKLNVFVSTGADDLRRIIVRLDNAKIADIDHAPWSTVLDTSTLQPGYHMVEVWAEGSGDRPQSSTKSMSFYIVDHLPPTYAVAGSRELLQTSTVAGAPAPADPASYLPSFLAGRDVDPKAAVEIRSDNIAVDRGLSENAPLTISSPTLLYFEPSAGGDATRYAYALVRDGRMVAQSKSPEPLNFDRLRLRPRSDTVPGLRSGAVTLYVWGIDQIGRPSEPVIRAVVIQEEAQ